MFHSSAKLAAGMLNGLLDGTVDWTRLKIKHDVRWVLLVRLLCCVYRLVAMLSCFDDGWLCCFLTRSCVASAAK